MEKTELNLSMEEKKLIIPYLKVLNVLHISSADILLEEKSLRLPVMHNSWPHLFPYVPMTAVDVAYCDRGLVFRFTSYGKGLRCQFTEDGSDVYKDSCVEIFMQRPNDEKYYNFEFNCCGVCDASYRQSRSVSTPFSEAQYMKLERHSSIHREVFDDPYNMRCFTVTCLIPYSLIGIDCIEQLPEFIKFNFYRCGDETSIPHFASWMPIDSDEPNFHLPQFFKPLYFGER